MSTNDDTKQTSAPFVFTKEMADRSDARMRREKLRDRARTTGVPEDEDLRVAVLADHALDTASICAVTDAIEWRGDRTRGCVRVVGGMRGTGKTVALARAVVRFDRGARFVTAPEITATPRNGWSANEEKWSEWIRISLLAIDDLGTEKGDVESVTSLIWQRYDAGRITLATTNLSRSDIAERYFAGDIGSRVADRLLRAQGRDGGADGLPWYVAVSGASLRSESEREKLRASMPNVTAKDPTEAPFVRATPEEFKAAFAAATLARGQRRD